MKRPFGRIEPGQRVLRKESGQAIAELAIVLIPLLLLILAILQFGFIYNAQIGLTNAVRDTARYGSTLVANDAATATTAADRGFTFLTTSLGTYVAPYSSSRLVTGAGASRVCYVQHDDGNSSDDPVWVSVTASYRHPLLVPLVGSIIDLFDGAADDSFMISATTEIRVDNPSTPVPAVASPGPCDFL